MIILMFSIITVVIALFIAFVVVFKQRRLSNIAFSISLLSTGITLLGDALCFVRPEWLDTCKKVVFISEAIMAPSWLLFALGFARTDYWNTISRFSKILIFLSPLFMIFLLTMPIEDFFYSPEFEAEGILFLGNIGYIFNLLLLLYSIVAIICLESTLKSSSGTNRWQIKYLLIGVGGILAINIFYYSHALLYRSINMNLLPVRTGVFFISILFIGFSLLKRKAMDVEVAVSRRVLYRSLSIFIIGFYLLGLGIIGEGMRYLGPKVGKNITTFLGFAGAIGLITLILSEQLRRKAIVFINKNFYSQKYDYRKEWLQFTHRISSKHSFEELLEAIAEGFKDAIGVKSAAIWLEETGNEGYYCAKAINGALVKIKPDMNLVEFLKNKKWVFNTHDINCKDIAENNTEFIKASNASLIVPLLNVDRLIGFIVLGEGLAGNDYNFEDYDLLKTLSRQATAAIMNARLTEELTESKEMEAMGRLSSFIMHDLKNATSMLSLIAQNAKEHIDDPDFQRDAIKAISNTADRMKGIMERLKSLPGKIELNLEEADLGRSVKETIKEINLNGGLTNKTKLIYEELDSVRTRFDKEEIKKVIINLIINAFDATAMNGEVKVTVGKDNSMAFIKVSDNGCGMSKEFIEKHLFKPFQTTKKKGLGIGLYQCKVIVEAHSGRVKVKSEKGKGTDFYVYLPLKD
jgi:hypothetical protein